MLKKNLLCLVVKKKRKMYLIHFRKKLQIQIKDQKMLTKNQIKQLIT